MSQFIFYRYQVKILNAEIQSFFLRFHTWIMNFLYNYPSENRMKFTKLKVACKYASIGRGCASTWFTACCKIYIHKKNYFYPWDFSFRTALNGLRAEISIESKWVCRHIKLSSYFNHRVTNAKTQFDMAVNPLWFNINLKTTAPVWREHCGSSLPECYFQKMLFFMNNLDKTTVVRNITLNIVFGILNHNYCQGSQLGNEKSMECR